LKLRPSVRSGNSLGALFYPHVEAVLHDMSRNRIARIWNPYSGRSVDGESVLDAETLAAISSGEVMGPCEQVAVDGRPVTSVSVPLVDARYLLCVNLDRSPLTTLLMLLGTS
jgi:D-arginine utilization repressor